MHCDLLVLGTKIANAQLMEGNKQPRGCFLGSHPSTGLLDQNQRRYHHLGACLAKPEKIWPSNCKCCFEQTFETRACHAHLISFSSSTQCYSTQCFSPHNVAAHNATALSAINFCIHSCCQETLHPCLQFFFWTYSTRCYPFQWHIQCLPLKVTNFSSFFHKSVCIKGK